MDPQAQYEVVQAEALGFDYCLTDHRLQPNLVIAETIGRTEGLLLHREWVRIVRLTGYGTRSVTTAA
jgi:hypothetical protein